MTNARDLSMLSDCQEVVDIPKERGGPGYTQWEQEFLESIERQLGNGAHLSSKQRGILQELWERI